MTMGLAIIMIVLIGVMGAGLLTFVQRDLDSVVEENRGQKAFELADAGVQIARRQILLDAEPEHYDMDDSTDSLYYNSNCNDPGDDDDDPLQGPRTPAGEDWSPEAGVTRDFADGEVEITIRWMPRDPTTDSRCKAPVNTGIKPYKAQYYQVIATSEYSGARRKVEAILSTYDLGMPKGYFTPGDIKISGGACISEVSVFSLGDIDLNGGGSGCSGGGKVEGVDIAYGDWQNEFNATARGSSSAGFGAVGEIDSSTKTTGRDYDALTNPEFVQDPTSPQPSTEISFPFDYQAQSGSVDAERLQFYEEIARSQGNYMEMGGSNPDLTTWPSNATYQTVVYVKLTNPGTELIWKVNPSPAAACSEDSRKRGVLIVDGGGFKISNSAGARSRFSGYLVVRGGSTGTHEDVGGQTCFEGYVNASGEIKINGNPNPGTTADLTNSPGLYGVRTWSWRETYQ